MRTYGNGNYRVTSEVLDQLMIKDTNLTIAIVGCHTGSSYRLLPSLKQRAWYLWFIDTDWLEWSLRMGYVLKSSNEKQQQ